MFNRLLSIASLCFFLFCACKKDPPVQPNSVMDESAQPFVLKNEIYPNPCKGSFTSKTNTTDSQEVRIFNILGLQLLNLTIKGTTAIVDNSLENGIYFLSISGKYGTSSSKLIVSK